MLYGCFIGLKWSARYGQFIVSVAIRDMYSIKHCIVLCWMAIKLLFVWQCNIRPLAASSDSGTTENSYCPIARSKLISLIDFYNTSMRTNRLQSSFTSASPRVQDLVSLASLHLSNFAEL